MNSINHESNKRNTSRSVFELKVEKLTGGGKQFYNEERHNFAVFLTKCSFRNCFVLLVDCKNNYCWSLMRHNTTKARVVKEVPSHPVCHRLLLIQKFFSPNTSTCTNFTFLFSLSERPYRSFQSFMGY